MGNKMLIDAAHPEETRVVVVRGNRVEEFDFESQSRKQLRGSIFLAKVIRVEPSLQAAFVDYGGNRHGFLAFSEIHPDYYRIPYADAARQEQHRNGSDHNGNTNGTRSNGRSDAGSQTAPGMTDQPEGPFEFGAARQTPGSDTVSMALDAAVTPQISGDLPDTEFGPTSHVSETALEQSGAIADTHDTAETGEDAPQDGSPYIQQHGHDEGHEDGAPSGDGMTAQQAADGENGDDDDDDDDDMSVDDGGDHAVVESVGGEDALEEVPQRDRHPRRRMYKIQEVIKRNQIILVQVVKEERGTKGAALTTFLSLAGRYTVLMPNTGSGGGISRKITTAADRKRLKEIATELEVPQGMGLIVRTAGASRTKAEIKRDYEYLLRLWENVRDLTLKSKAPTLVYEEGDLIKRSIRDLYNREIDEVMVAGENAYRDAKDFMRMLMPSHAKNVQHYRDSEPLFTRHGVEGQLNMLFNPRVTLKSGGYIIINQTEALVAVDVNSGKSTREHSIEETALKTNIEAAEEIARQLRLRDLAGLIVIDFIDMEEKRNNRSVERKLKDCLRDDRARIQVGRISPFGLLEMSRQRLRTGMVEGSTKPCPVCDGTGIIRSTESVALMVLRAIEDHLFAKGPANLAVSISVDAALYILNNKRTYLQDIETRYGVTISVNATGNLQGSAYAIERIAPPTPRYTEAPKTVQMTWAHHGEETESDTGIEDDGEGPEESGEQRTADGLAEPRSRRRRRRKRFRNGHDHGPEHQASTPLRQTSDGEGHVSGELDETADDADADETPGEQRLDANGDERRPRRSRRRGRRGGHRHRGLRLEGEPQASGEAVGETAEMSSGTAEIDAPDEAVDAPPSVTAQQTMAEEPVEAIEEAAPAPRPAARKSRAPAEPRKEVVNGTGPIPPVENPLETAPSPAPEPTEPAPPARQQPLPEAPRRLGPLRGGWWQRRIG